MNSRLVSVVAAFAFVLAGVAHAKAPTKPNIVWIIVDDMSANLSCYGEKLIETPNVDRMARQGTRFAKAFTTAPVCSPSRSALITGMYQTTIGAQNHRSGRGTEKIYLPDGVVPLPKLFQQAGYYTCIGGGQPAGKKAAAKGKAGGALGKTDYNFEYDQAMYDGPDWAGRAAGQPFFMQVQLSGGKQRGGKDGNAIALSQRAAERFGAAVKPEDVTLPPYYPRDPVLLRDWAAYLDSCRFTDLAVGGVLARLEKEGELENTVVCFMTDHGISHARGKQFLYDEGIRVPLVMRGPGVPKGAVREDLVSHIDLAATSLALAGIERPEGMQSRDLLAKDYQPRDAVFSARDRCDETVEHIRSVRTDRYKYVRNFLPARPHLQPNNYKDGKSIVMTLRELHAAGKLDELQERILFAPTRAPEELYDLQADPFETKNLAAVPTHAATLAELRGRLDAWIRETGDKGNVPETAAMYDSDMRVYVGEKKKGDENRSVTERNIAQMKAWAAEGK
ncbi:MAG: sulfatase [Pirellula sp.]|nr:sulfatase [Pirellula sp.]